MNWAEYLLLAVGTIVTIFAFLVACFGIYDYFREKFDLTHPKSFEKGRQSMKDELMLASNWFKEVPIVHLIQGLAKGEAITTTRDRWNQEKW